MAGQSYSQHNQERSDLLPIYARPLVGMTINVHTEEHALSGGYRRTVIIKLDSVETLLEWVKKIHAYGEVDGQVSALEGLQSDARQLFSKVFGVELK